MVSPVQVQKAYGQYQQDRIVLDSFFKNNDMPEKYVKGVYVDIGAHDGVSISNTKLFDDMGWNGLCIEANPNLYQELCKNRPNAVNLNVAVYDRAGTIPFRINEGFTNMLSGIEEAYHPIHRNRIEEEIRVNGGSYHIQNVPCLTLDEILYKNKLDQVDFLSIDVEGAELAILKGINFERTLIYVILIEDNYQMEKEYDNILLPHGYKKYPARAGIDIMYYLPRYTKQKTN